MTYFVELVFGETLPRRPGNRKFGMYAESPPDSVSCMMTVDGKMFPRPKWRGIEFTMSQFRKIVCLVHFQSKLFTVKDVIYLLYYMYWY